MQILVIQKTLRDAPVTTGVLDAAEELLTQEIDADDNNYESYANRSVVRARRAEWENALQDATKVSYSAYPEATDDSFISQSIAIQPSLLGFISKGIALCGIGQNRIWDAMEAFDLAFIFYNHNPIIVDLLLLIKVSSFLFR